MNGISKIKAFLKDNGTSMHYETTDYYSYYDGFHAHQSYPVDVYSLSNGMYVLVKPQGKPKYYLCEDSNMRTCKIIDFSQYHFIKRVKESCCFQ